MSRRWREGVKWRKDNGKIVCTESFQLLGGRTVRTSNGLSPAVPCSEFNKHYANCDSLPSVKLHLESSSSSHLRTSCLKIICTFADRRRKREQEIDLDFASRPGSLIPNTQLILVQMLNGCCGSFLTICCMHALPPRCAEGHERERGMNIRDLFQDGKTVGDQSSRFGFFRSSSPPRPPPTH